MTPAERAVIDAARALVPIARGALDAARIVQHAEHEPSTMGYDVPPVELDKLKAATDALEAAVRALPRPLSEQLAELRVGAVVEVGNQHLYAGKSLTVLGNRPKGRTLWLDADGPGGALFEYEEITRIISNPEESNG